MGLTGAPNGGPAPYQFIALISFKSTEALRQALASHRDEVFASISNYTDSWPSCR